MNFRTSPVAVLLGIVGFAAVVGATTVGVLLALPNSSNPATTLTMVFGFFGLLVTLISSLVLGNRANQKLDVVAGDTKRLLNGEMEDKIAGVVERLVPEIVHQVLDERTGSKRATT